VIKGIEERWSGEIKYLREKIIAEF